MKLVSTIVNKELCLLAWRQAEEKKKKKNLKLNIAWYCEKSCHGKKSENTVWTLSHECKHISIMSSSYQHVLAILMSVPAQK